MEDQLQHESLRIKRHKEAVDRAMQDEDATFKPSLTKKTKMLTTTSERLVESRNTMPLHVRLYSETLKNVGNNANTSVSQTEYNFPSKTIINDNQVGGQFSFTPSINKRSKNLQRPS